MKFEMIRFRHIAAALMMAASGVATAQDNLLPMMREVPQSRSANPAIAPACGGHISFPALNVKAGVANGFTWDDLFTRSPKTDSLNFDLDKLSDNMPTRSLTSVGVSDVLLGFGFTVKGKTHVTLELVNKTTFGVVIPRSILDLRYGNWDFDGDRPVRRSITDIDISASNYMEIALGGSHRINDQWRVGLTLKYLAGLVAAKTNRFSIDINNYRDGVNYMMDFLTHADITVSAPLDVTLDENGDVSSVEFDDDDLGDKLKPFKNNGFAIDLGVLYKPMDNLEVGASLIDLGSINWKQTVQRFYAESDFRFSGLNVNDAIEDPDFVREDSYYSELQDSLEQAIKFKYEEQSASFKTKLPTQLLLTARYTPYKWLDAGFLTRMRWVEERLQTHVGLSAGVHAGSVLTAMLSAGYNTGRYLNVGAGMVLRGGPVQFHLLTDNLSGLIKPTKAQGVDVRFGINFLIGRRRLEKAAKAQAETVSVSVD